MDKKAKILVVEDENIVGADLKQTLIKLNYQVVDIVRSGEEAINMALEKKPDLILMDIMLNGNITGIEAAKTIKEEIDVPVIYLTAYTDEKTLQNATLTDPFGYVLKPFDERTLHFSIETALYKHKTNLKLKESEARYRTLVELSPIAICIYSNAQIAYANSAALKLFGAVTEKELLGKPFSNFASSNFQKFVEEQLMYKEFNTMKSEGVEEKILTIDGIELDVEVSALPTDYADKSALQIILRDIGEVKKRERIQQATVKILQSVNFSKSLTQLYDYLHKTLIDLLGIKNIAFAFYDDRTKKLSFSFFNDEYIKKAHSQLDEILTEHTIKSARLQLLSLDEVEEFIDQRAIGLNEKLPLKWMGVPLSVNENLTFILILKEYDNIKLLNKKTTDLISAIILPLCRAVERKLIEEDLKNSLEKLEESNQTKDNFFSLISHDLRSPFDSIMGFTEVLKNDLDSLSPEELKLYLDSLYLTSRHIYRLINNLLQYSKFQLGKAEFSQKSLKLTEIIRKNVEILKGITLKKEINITYNNKNDLTVYADEDMVNSIFLNLLTNAIKFTPRKGEIWILTTQQDGYVAVSIRDNGIGMDEQILEKIFKLDAKKSTPGTENEAGTGLGLLLVKEFIEKHTGTINVISIPSKGTTFTFTLPIGLSETSN